MSRYTYQDRRSIANSAVAHSITTPRFSGMNDPIGSSDTRQRRPSSRSRSYNAHRGNARPQSRQRGEQAINNKIPHPWKVFDTILREHNGNTNLHNIKRLFPDMSEPDIKEWLENDKGKRFNVFTDSSDKISWVSVNCRGKLCLHYGQSECSRVNCTYFHLCRYYVAGHCKNGVQCQNSHHFQEEHNKEMVKKYSLTKYNERELRIIISMSVPQVCGKYNSNTCTLSDSCRNLHICENTVMTGSCQDENCNLTQTFDSDHTKKILKVFNLHKLYEQNKLNLLSKYILIKKNPQKDNDKISTVSNHPRDSSSQPYEPSNRRGRPGRGRSGSSSRTSSRHRHSSTAENGNEVSANQLTKLTAQETEKECNSRASFKRNSRNPDLEETWAGPKSYPARHNDRPLSSSRPNSDSNRSSTIRSSGSIMNTSSVIATGDRQQNSATNIVMKPRIKECDLSNAQINDGGLQLATCNITQNSATNIARKPLVDCDMSYTQIRETLVGNRIPSAATVHSVRSSSKYDLMDRDICIDNLQPHGCSLGNLCRRLHCDKPYAWYINAFDKWLQIDSNKETEVEKAYQCPEKNSHEIKLQLDMLDKPLKVGINFDSLTAIVYGEYSQLPVTRRCTPRSKWQWYWGSDDEYYKLQQVLSEAIEKGFNEKKSSSCDNSSEFSVKNGDVYLVNYQNLKLTIVKPTGDLMNYSLKRRPMNDV